MSWKDDVKKAKAKKAPKPSLNGKHKPPAPPPAEAPAEENPLEDMLDDGLFPFPPRQEAYHGLAGDLVKLIEPHTESDPVAILMQTLVCFGSLIGRTAYYMVENTPHYMNLFAVLVGKTSRARKGTSWRRVLQPFAGIEPEFFDERIKSGLSSAEGLIKEVRDPVIKRQKITDPSRTPGEETIEVDEGVKDKRLLIYESEFANVLKQDQRQGNTLSITLRQAWDGERLSNMAKNCGDTCKEPHLSIVGHVTRADLRKHMSSTSAENGTGNRINWVAVRRSQELPFGGGHVDLSPISKRLSEAISFAKCVKEMPMDEDCKEVWPDEYHRLTADRPGVVGALTARSDPITLRLACLYALLDRNYQIELPHLRAALALWDYCQRSVAYIFNESTGDTLADKILALLKQAREGVSRTDIYHVFNGHVHQDRIQSSLSLLSAYGMAYMEMIKGKGRPVERWRYGSA